MPDFLREQHEGRIICTGSASSLHALLVEMKTWLYINARGAVLRCECQCL